MSMTVLMWLECKLSACLLDWDDKVQRGVEF